jgi:two-component system chemotaxis response regulator CheB
VKEMSAKTKLLIVDDSRIFRSAIEESLTGVSDIEVIGSVWNGVKAMEFIQSNRPDLVTLDVEMPDMDGLETLKAIQKINASSKGSSKPIGVIMLSSHTKAGADTTIKALEMGAFDFIPKPEGKDLGESMELLRSHLVVKIRHFATKGAAPYLAKTRVAIPPLPRITPELTVSSTVKAIVIGVSTGGPRAMATMLPSLCERVDVPILIVQHMPATFTESLARSLNAMCRYTVTEGADDEVIQKEHVYIAPGGRHMLLREHGQTVRLVVNDQPPDKGCKPSVDILFRSAASVYGKGVIAIVLTGMGVDGTRGAAALKRAGAFVIVQDQETSVVWGMPGSVQGAGWSDAVLPLHRIPHAVIARIMQKNEE